MPTVKTAFTIDENLMEKINHLKSKLRISRSKLITEAIKEYVEKDQNREMFHRLNDVYADYDSSENSKLINHSKNNFTNEVIDKW